MRTSCGVFIFDKNNLVLIGHPTNASWTMPYWSIPKGEPDEFESRLETALREVKEETGISLDPKIVVTVGSNIYTSGKKVLYAYATRLKVSGESLNAFCHSSFINKEGKEIREIDKFEWVNVATALTKLHEGQILLLNKANELLINGGLD